MQELTYNLQDRPAVQKDAFGNRTQFSYGLDGKVRAIRRLGDGNWNTGAGDNKAAAQDAAASLRGTAGAPSSSMSTMPGGR